MDICNSGHVEIVFDSLTCPMCALKANKDGEIDTLRDDVLELTGKIEELETSRDAVPKHLYGEDDG